MSNPKMGKIFYFRKVIHTLKIKTKTSQHIRNANNLENMQESKVVLDEMQLNHVGILERFEIRRLLTDMRKRAELLA